MIRNLRITTGLVLFVFVATHLGNLGFGLISIEMMDTVRRPLMAFWTNSFVELVLVATFLVHIGLGLQSLYRRGTLRMSRTDAVQFITALLIPPLLIPHIVGTMVAANRFGIFSSYASLAEYFWIYDPTQGLRQVLVLVVTWIHGCVGLFTWLRLQLWWEKVAPYCYPLAVAIPVVALLGFVQAGNDVMNPPDPAPVAETAETASNEEAFFADPVSAPVTQESLDALYSLNRTLTGLYLAALAITLLARFLRLRRSRSVVYVKYANGPSFEHDTGLSLLELATVHNVPHANLCRGRGRCGTCRIRIVENDTDLPPATDMERKTLDRLQAPDDVRLACQLAPGSGQLTVERLLPPYMRPEDIKRYNDTGEADPDSLEPELA